MSYKYQNGDKVKIKEEYYFLPECDDLTGRIVAKYQSHLFEGVIYDIRLENGNICTMPQRGIESMDDHLKPITLNYTI